MALSIVEILKEHGYIDALAQAFARRFTQEPDRGQDNQDNYEYDFSRQHLCRFERCSCN